MGIHILIVDDSADYRALLKKRISKAYPDAQIEEYDPMIQERPGPGFPWGDYDVLILDYQLGHDTGLDWLREFKGSPNFPATIFLTGQGNETVAVKALKLGVNDYIRKMDLTPELLQEAIDSALATRGDEAVLEQTQAHDYPTMASNVIEDIPPAPFNSQQIQAGNAQIGGYHIKHMLGQGGMATVYLAEQEGTGQEVAVKFLDLGLTVDERYIDRFLEEYSLVSKFEHPNLIKIYEQGFTDTHGYIVMEVLAGGDLKEKIKQGLDYRTAVKYMRDLAGALYALHQAGVVHRDLKPSNVLFREDGSLVLTDFGMAKKMDSRLELTQAGEVVGTPFYISPEQVQNQAGDERSDLYSLGIMFYEMLAGKRPFTASSAPALMYKHVYEEAEEIADIPEKAQTILKTLMAKKPEDRYQDAKLLQMHLMMI